jgi:S-adenosyl-L-methionine hydrolase (adenosine-forming)
MARKILTLITLLSDFGLADPYVAQIKAVIRTTISDTEIIDISHEIEKHNITAGSFLLETTAPFFPTGSIHVGIVDPGVGGTRLPIVIACEKGVLIGPDNGLLHRASRKLGFQAAYRITNSKFNRNNVSSTFHGRDIFAFTAAQIAEGSDPKEVGPELDAVVSLNIPDPESTKNTVKCRVLYVDSFGNIITNIPESSLDKLGFRHGMHVKIISEETGEQYDGLTTISYFDIPERRFGLLLGSQGFVEIALKEASAAAWLHSKPLDSLSIRFS